MILWSNLSINSNTKANTITIANTEGNTRNSGHNRIKRKMVTGAEMKMHNRPFLPIAPNNGLEELI